MTWCCFCLSSRSSLLLHTLPWPKPILGTKWKIEYFTTIVLYHPQWCISTVCMEYTWSGRFAGNIWKICVNNTVYIERHCNILEKEMLELDHISLSFLLKDLPH